MAPPMEIDPVNSVLGLMALLVGVIMLVIKLHKIYRPHNRRNRRHHTRRRTGDRALLDEPSKQHQDQDQHVQYGQLAHHGKHRRTKSQPRKTGTGRTCHNGAPPQTRRSPRNSTIPQPHDLTTTTNTTTPNL